MGTQETRAAGGPFWLCFLATAVARLPWRALGIMGTLLGWLAGSVLRIRRAHVEHAMRAAGLNAPGPEARAMYSALGRSAFEFLWMSRRGDEALGHISIDPASRAIWRNLLAECRGEGRGEDRGERRGIVLAASHTGNWDLAAAAAARDVELLVVTKHLSAPSIDRFWQSTRARLGVRLADARGAMAAGREVLRRGGAVAMMIDQVPGSPSHATGIDFLGRRALADRAPAAMAAATGAPLVVVAGRADSRGEHVMHVLAVIRPPSRAHRAGTAWIAEATAASAAALDAFVRAHPSQWLWMHRRWRGVSAGDGVGVGVGVDRGGHPSTLVPRWSRSQTRSRPESPSPGRSKTRSSSPDAASRAG